MKDYPYGRGFNGAPFCATCGEFVFGRLYGPPADVVSKLSPERQEFVRKQLRIVPVNLRVLNGIDWSELNIERSDEGTQGYALNDW